MTYSVKYARSGLTAIAAVLALSSTPLLAQEVTETPTEPVAETTAAPEPAAEPAPEATAPEPAAEPTAAPAKASTTTRRTATKTTTTTTRRASSQPASTAAPIAAVPATEATAQPMPVPPPTGAMVDPGAMPVDETATAETTAAPADESLPIAAAAGLGLLALGGIGMAVGRRRQRKEELAHQRANREYLASHPDTPESHAPAAFAGAAAAPAMAGSVGQPLKDAPRTKLPPDFDLSRFGPHTRAAYLGPTEDNPSLSMKHRLRRATAMDQQARQYGEAQREAAVKAPAPRTDQAKKSMQPMWNVRNDGFMLRRAEDEKAAFQH